MIKSKKEQKDLERLTSLGPERLAKMLVERAMWDDGTARAVEQALAETDPAKTVVSKVKKELGRYTDSRLAGAWHKSSVISRELDHLRILIADSILPKAPDNAIELLEKLIERHIPVFNNVDDSNGLLGDVFRQAVRDWGNAWSRRTDRKTRHIADMVFKKITSNEYGMYDQMVTDFSAALGVAGIAELEKLVRQELAKMPAASEGEVSGRIDETWMRRGPLCSTLEDIADLRNDPDGYIEAVTLMGRPDEYAGEIAERLIKARRFEETLGWIERGGRLPRHDAAQLQATCLVALGRKAEARELLWQNFLQTLSGSSYAGALKLAPQDEIEGLKQAAIEAALKHRDALTALSFFLKHGLLAEAAALIIARWQELNGEHYHTLRPAAEKLELVFPLSAVLLRRRLIDAILEKANSKYYGYAVSDLKRAAIVSKMVKDWQGIDDHERYLDLLRVRHGKKSSFWSHLRDDRD